MDRLQVVLLVLLVGLAGCGGAAQQSPPTDTLTAVPVPAETPSPSPSLSSPDAGDSAGPTATATATGSVHWLVRNHQRGLDGRSLTVRLERTVLAANGTVVHQQWVDARVSADRNRYHVVTITDRGPERTRETLRSIGDGNGGTPGNALSGGPPAGVGPRYDAARRLLLPDPTLEDRLSTLLRAPSVSVVGQLDLKNYDVDVTTPVDPALIAAAEGVGTVENASLALLIDQRGLVRFYRFAYVTTVGGDRVTVVERGGFVRVGQTDLDGPATFLWASEGVRNDSATPTAG